MSLGSTRRARAVRSRPAPAGLLTWLRVLRALGLRALPWPNPEVVGKAAAVLHGHGLVVDSDQRRVLRRALAGADDAALLIESLYLSLPVGS